MAVVTVMLPPLSLRREVLQEVMRRLRAEDMRRLQDMHHLQDRPHSPEFRGASRLRQRMALQADHPHPHLSLAAHKDSASPGVHQAAVLIRRLLAAHHSSPVARLINNPHIPLTTNNNLPTAEAMAVDTKEVTKDGEVDTSFDVVTSSRYL